MNTKDAAADIQITVNGGEGLRWHYLPTAIRPGGLRAVVPTVVGTGRESTLVQNSDGTITVQAVEKRLDSCALEEPQKTADRPNNRKGISFYAHAF